MFMSEPTTLRDVPQVSLQDLQNESDVEQKLIFPLLIGRAPDGLGFWVGDIATKASLLRFKIDKGQKEKLYYPDYVVVLAGLPAIVVEAKSPQESVDEGFREARLYATELNALFETGTNPCAQVISCNGLELVLGNTDAKDPTLRLSLSELHAASSSFAQLVDSVGRTRTRKRIEIIRKSISAHPLTRPSRLVGGDSVRNEEIPHNSFGAEIALSFRRLFNPTTIEDRVRVVKQAYVSSKRRERFVEPIDRLIRGVTPRTLTHARDLEDSASPAELTQILARGSELERQVVLLVGSVGSGKSTFVDYLEHIALDNDLREQTLWVRVDLNVGPVNRELAYGWLTALILEKLRLASPDQDFDDLENLERVFGPELRTFKKGPLKLLDEATVEYKARLADELTRLIRDQLRFGQCLARYLCGPKGKLLVIVLDNSDKRNRDEQLLMFEIANWVQEQFRCLTILPLRDVTYDAHRHEPPLDTALKDLVFRIEPPLFHQVLQKRIRLVLDELDMGRGRRQFKLPNGIRVDYPASDFGMYLACILRSLFEYDKFLRRLLSGLAGRDVRKALELFLEFCSSGHIGSDQILKIRASEGEYILPFQVVANVLLRMDRRFYDGTRSHVLNVFQCAPEDALPDHFSRIGILSWLAQRLRNPGPSGQRGYFRVADLIGALAQNGHDADRIAKDLLSLLERGCIVAEHQRVDSLEPEDLVAVTAGGTVHLDLAKEELYLAACAEDTWLTDKSCASRIASRIGVPRAQHLRASVFRRNASELAEYLFKESQRRLSPSQPYLTDPEPVPLSVVDGLKTFRKGTTQNRGVSQRICLRNVSFSADRNALVAEIQRLIPTGTVTDCHLVERDRRRTGTAFVEFSSSEAADEALETLDGAVVLGRTIIADVAFDRTKSRARQQAGRRRSHNGVPQKHKP